MRCLRATAAAFLTLSTAALVFAQSQSNNLETFPSILPDSTSSVLSTATAFDPSGIRSGPGPALPSFSTTSTPSSYNASRSSASSRTRTTLISASHSPLPSLDPSGSEYVITSTVDGSVATVTVISPLETASVASGSSSSSNAAAPRQSRSTGYGRAMLLVALVAVAAVGA